MSAICSIAFTTLALPPDADNLGDRSSVTLTLLLTAVAYKYVIADQLPKIPYNTKLDLHLNMCFALLLVITVENGLVAFFTDADMQAAVDRYFYVVIGVLWCCWHLVFSLVVARYVAKCRALLGPSLASSAMTSKVLNAQGLAMFTRS